MLRSTHRKGHDSGVQDSARFRDRVQTSAANDGGAGPEAPRSLAHRARTAGMNPNHWYPAAFSKDVKPKKVTSTMFWKQSIALYRGEDGVVRAIDDRCPHRGIPLRHGSVEGCNVVCLYHGWTFGPDGQLVGMKHDDFGKKLPNIRNRTYPVKERYGLVWFFPGDPRLAACTPLVEIPEAEGPGAWSSLSFAYTWKAHHSMVIDNLCNLTHLWVHGRWVPYGDTVLSAHSAEGDRLTLSWEHELRRDILHPVTAPVFRRSRDSNLSDTFMVFDYPYQSALSNERVRSTNFMLPRDEGRTTVFTVQFWAPPKTGFQWPASVFQAVAMPVIRPITKEIFRQDGFTVEEEHRAYHEDPSRPIPEPNPMVRRFNELTVRKWDEYLAYERSGGVQTPAQRAEQVRRRTL